MKRSFLAASGLLLFSLALAQNARDGRVEFTSTDAALEKGFRWAKQQALMYVRRGNDPVGAWYEAALPEREAFCMRDVSHQLMGANILGLQDINKNLLTRFTRSISASRDWCGYWEIDKMDRPAPVDYRSDDDFWYNLPGSFDILNACLRQYQWTGDTTFLYNRTFQNFYQHTCQEYVSQWDQDGDGIMEGTSSREKYYRGIGSYEESLKGSTGSDLIAAQAMGYTSYATLLTAIGKEQMGKPYLEKSQRLQMELNSKWWDPAQQSYFQFFSKDAKIHSDASQLFLMRWNIVPENRIKVILSSVMKQEEKMNVETQSYYAREVFCYGDPATGVRLLKDLTSAQLKRREYPEVSFAAIETYTEGLMGVEVDAAHKTIKTLSRVATGDEAKLSQLPILDGTITIEHIGSSKSIFTNNTHQTIYWNASFYSEGRYVKVNGKLQKADVELDLNKREYVVYRVKVAPGAKGVVENE